MDYEKITIIILLFSCCAPFRLSVVILSHKMPLRSPEGRSQARLPSSPAAYRPNGLLNNSALFIVFTLLKSGRWGSNKDVSDAHEETLQRHVGLISLPLRRNCNACIVEEDLADGVQR